MQVTCIITKRIQWMNPSWLHYPLIRKATCSLGDSDILLNPWLLVFVLKEKDVKYKFVQSENLIDWSRGKKVVGARMRFVQSCTQRKRYILKHGQELITFYANHMCCICFSRPKVEQIEKVFTTASKQKSWDHFSKAQRKNLDMWRKQAEVCPLW